MSSLKEKLYKELKLKLTLAMEGVQYDVGIFDKLLELKAIEYAIKIFGKGKVRSNFVVGLQPKEVLFEGLEYLGSIGVVTVASSWIPAVGSPLEGHRSPSADWHWDVQLRHAALLRKYGRTYQEILTPRRRGIIPMKFSRSKMKNCRFSKNQKLYKKGERLNV
jgi:hypothetical protein